MEQALIVRRWRRYGADRLYVTADTGAPLGSVDLATGQVALTAPRGGGGADAAGGAAAGVVLAEAVRRAAQAYLRSDLPEVVVPVAELIAPPAPVAGVAETRLRGRRARTASDGAPETDPRTSGTAPRDVQDPSARGRHRAEGLVSPRVDGEPHPWHGDLRESLCDRLDRLGLEGWHVLHDVPVGRQGSVVAHLLIGPPGAFAVAGHESTAAPDDADWLGGAPGATRFLPADGVPAAQAGQAGLSAPAAPAASLTPRHYVLDGRYLSADGQGVPDLRDVRLTAARAGSLLRAAVGSAVTVRGVLVVHGTVEHRDPAPFDALVVADGSVPEVFATLPQRWTPGRVDAVAAVARRRATWALSRAV